MSRRTTTFALYCCALVTFLTLANQSSANDTLTEGSSSKQHRNQTVNSIPFQQLNQLTKEKITGILEKPSLYRQLPVTAINVDPDYFKFLVRYPEVIVNIWQMMGVTKMSTKRTGPYSLSSNDGAGTMSSLELVYGTDNLHIFYGTGSYEGPILKRKIKGRCVLVLRSENSIDAEGKPVATSKLDVFLKVDNATAGLIAKTIQPLVGITADHNFVESLKFVQRLNETTSQNGPGVQRMGEKLNIDPNVRQHFNEVVDVVFQRAINASAPAEIATPVRSGVLKTPYPASGSPSRIPNPKTPQPYPQSGFRMPEHQQFNDLGQSRQVYPSQNGHRTHYARGTAGTTHYGLQPGRPSPLVRGDFQLPAHGYQAPVYDKSAAGMLNYPYPSSRPVQASYNFVQQQPGSVQPAGGWRPR